MRSRSAFTLIELMVAVTIIGLLIAAAALSLTNARIQARDAQRVADLSTIAKALDEHGRLRRNQPLLSTGTFQRCVSELSDLEPYFVNRTAPTDPRPAAPGTCPSSGGGYVYHQHLTGEVGNLATDESLHYLLMAAFERDPQEELKSSLTAAPAGYSPADRTTYYLPGAFCGTACP